LLYCGLDTSLLNHGQPTPVTKKTTTYKSSVRDTKKLQECC